MHAGEYTPNNFTPVISAMNLYDYVDKITSNANKFPEYSLNEKKAGEDVIRILYMHQDSLVNRVREQAYQIHMLLWTANEINVRKEPDRKPERLYKQLRAIELCDEHLAAIQLCRKRFHLTNKRIRYWGKMTLKVRDAAKAWHKSDVARYKDI